MRYHVDYFDFDCEGELYLDSSRETDSPAEALKFWYAGQAEHPTCCDVSVHSREDENTLKAYALSHASQLAKWATQYNCPYKQTSIIDACRRSTSGFLGTAEWTDSIYPFCIG